jgi:hypothetical protein
MLKRTTVIATLLSLVGVIASVSCNPPLTPTSVLMTDPASSPTDIVLTDTPASPPTIMPTETPTLASCSWIAYLNGEPTSSLSDENCLDDLKSIGISGDSKKISFSVHRLSSLGTYGVCQDISGKDNLKFSVSVQDSIAFTRFLIMVGPEPIPTKQFSHGFRIQSEILKHEEKDIWIKFIEYVLDDFEEDEAKIQAIPYWKLNGFWNFEFVYQFSGSQGYTTMNKKTLSLQWPLNSSNRYLCFAYQQMPTEFNAAELEVLVNFP